MNCYDIFTCHVLLCIVVDMIPVCVMNVFNYTVVDVMTGGNANMYVVLITYSCYFRVW